MIEHPVRGRLPVGRGVVPLGLVGGVDAEQVVQANRPGARSATMCVRVSSRSAAPASDLGIPARLAAAGSGMSGPGCSPSRRNIRAAAGLSWS